MKPITSRIKRSPLFSYGESPAKQTAKGGSTTKGKDEIVTEKKEVRKQASKDFEAKCYNADGSRKRGVPGCKWADEEGTVAPNETEIVETSKTIEGKDKDIEFDLMEMESEGKLLSVPEVRRQLRAVDKASRKKSSARRRMGRYGEFVTDESGKETFKANPNLSEREKRKLQKAQDRYDVAGNLVTGVKKGTEQGRQIGESYERGQRKVPLGKRTEDQQKAQAERTKRIEENRAETELEGKSSGHAGKAVEVGAVNPFAGMEFNMDSTPLFTPTTDYMSLLRSPAGMTKKGYTQKAKSPAAKALKGAQNKLPQHLQDAIKTAPESPAKFGALLGAIASKVASPNKAKSGFKMKGYGKK
jgi:hypothetical protein